MDISSLIFIAFGLAADCFAVALSGSISMRSVSFLQVLRTSLAFGLFQGLMPVLGWLAGRTIVNIISTYDHWVAFILLSFVGGKMLWDASHPEKDEDKAGTDITKGLTLITLAIATSIDALAVGLSFAFLKIDIKIAGLIIGVVAFSITAVGFILGKRVGGLLGRRAKFAGGVILVGIGLKILLEHLL